MADAGGSAEIDAEDAKLVTLARSARARAGAAEGAAVRDDIGRTYAAACVRLPSLELTAMQAAVAAALSSGVQAVEAAVVQTSAGELTAADASLVADLSIATVLLVGEDGAVTLVR